MPRFRRRFILFIATLSSLLLSLVATSRARAQSLTVVMENSLARTDASGQQIPKRALPFNPEAINLQDCREDQRIRFPLQMAEFQPFSVVQAWTSTGADCSIPTNRKGDDPPCWSLVESIPLQTNIDVDIPVRAILSRTDDASICGRVDLTKVEVQFLMFAYAAEETAIVTKHVAIFADTIGPVPPTASVFAGNGRARVEVRDTSGLQSITAVNAYCEKSNSPSACIGSTLVPGHEPEPARECGSVVGSTGSIFFTTPIANGENHVVAVAARDAFGNVGPLSSVTCTTPSPDAETRVQSLDEPTGCAVSARGPLGFGPGLALGLLTLLIGRLRRRTGAR